jgi:maleylpyruvate isomerase
MGTVRSIEDVLKGLNEATAGLIGDVDRLADADVREPSLLPGWTRGHVLAHQQTPAEMVARSRLAEVLIHHVDLDVGFGPGSWLAAFVREMLTIVVRALSDHPLAPVTADLHATDTGRSFLLGGAAPEAGPISGTEAELLAWLLGRSDGAGLARADPGPLPPVPSIYLT